MSEMGTMVQIPFGKKIGMIFGSNITSFIGYLNVLEKGNDQPTNSTVAYSSPNGI